MDLSFSLEIGEFISLNICEIFIVLDFIIGGSAYIYCDYY